MSDLSEFCVTDRQKEVVNLLKDHSQTEAAKVLGVTKQAINATLMSVKKRAAKKGFAPSNDLTHPTAPGFDTKRVSTAYNGDGDIVLQWHIQEREKLDYEEIRAAISESFDIKPCKLKHEKKKLDSNLAACYLIGDHHFGMHAWGLEAWEDWDIKKSYKTLVEVCQRLINGTHRADVGYLINLGDFLHANDYSAKTPASGHTLDVDGRMGKVARQAGLLLKTITELMLQKHNKVVVINARGNHDPDSGLWLNEVLRAYFINNEQVEVMDNFRKFIWFEWGKNLVVTHHGDRMKWESMHQAIVTNLAEEWGRCKFRFGWTGHLHHECSKEIGGMKFERFGVLPPPDAWHAGEGYGSARTMSAITLHKELGMFSRNIVTI